MLEIALYSLGSIAALLALSGGLLAFWRMIPRDLPSAELTSLRGRVSELETVFAGFADQYELSFVRNAAKLGKLRRALAKERGEDVEEEADVQPQTPATTIPEPPSKDTLRRIAFGGNAA